LFFHHRKWSSADIKVATNPEGKNRGFTRSSITNEIIDRLNTYILAHFDITTMSFRRFLLLLLNAGPVSARCHLHPLRKYYVEDGVNYFICGTSSSESSISTFLGGCDLNTGSSSIVDGEKIKTANFC
jgi:hypothetical protein